MARVSFTLRRPTATVDLGSYLQYDSTETYETFHAGGAAASVGIRTDYDNALRADGLQLAPFEAFDVAFFEGTSACYGEVELSWGIQIEEEPDITPTVTGVVLVYSPRGEPQTIASGDILVESTNTYGYVHTGLMEGRWAYYSLFVHYESTGGDDYYERVATLAVLVPKDYGSTNLLWNRIPEYYRIQDTLAGNTGYSSCIGSVPFGMAVGPLYKFLSIVGFDIDRVRTILDYNMVSSDPNLSNSEHLGALGQYLDALLNLDDLGPHRLRSLMDDIGYFRRSKGTVSATQLFTQAVAGSHITLDQTTGHITVYSQRVNYITVPKNGIGITTHRAALDTEEFVPQAFSWTGASAGSGSYGVSGSTFTTTGTGASLGIQHVLIHNSSPIKVLYGDRVCFSVQSGVGTSAIKWARVVNGSGTTVGFQDVGTAAAGNVVFEVPALTGVSSTDFTDVFVEYLVDLSEVASFSNTSLLAERNFVGEYFDGDTKRGGWLIDSSSVSDYRWSGSANASASIYAEDYERTKGILTNLLYDVLPITEESKYTIVAYNAIPGF